MKLLVANHSASIHGGAEQYLSEVLPVLAARGLDVRVLTEDDTSMEGLAGWSVQDPGARARLDDWAPDVAFVNGLKSPQLEEWLLARYPTVLFAHNYYGTCVSGEKRHRFPASVTCSRRFGVPCAALYWTRGCGPLRPGEFVRSFKRQAERARLLPRYRSIVVASKFMQAEFERHGLQTTRIPLFVVPPPNESNTHGQEGPLVFIGRLAATKGVALMLDSVRAAREAIGEALPLVLLGDGTLRQRLERAVGQSGEGFTFRGWVSATERDEVLRTARLLLVPSVWPEPFGLVGLEAARFGVPAVAFGVGGIPDWLEDGRNGVLVDPARLTAEAFSAGIVRALKLLRGGPGLRAGAREVASRFRIECHVDALLSVFERARADRAPGSGP